MFKKVLTYILSLSFVLGNVTPAYAMPVVNSVGSVKEDIDTTPIVGKDTTQIKETEYYDAIAEDNTQTTNIYATIASNFKVTIPKTVILDGTTGIGHYAVRVEGDISGTESIVVEPEETFSMSQVNKEDITASVTQDKTDWVFSQFGTDALGTIEADLSAGKWNGTFDFNISKKLMAGESNQSGTLRLSETNVLLGLGQTKQVNAFVNDELVNEDVKWTSDNENITVNNGLIETTTSAQIGDTAKVTVTFDLLEINNQTAMINTLSNLGLLDIVYASEELSATFTVTIIDIELDIDKVNLQPGESFDVTANIIPNTITSNVIWSTDESKINLTSNENTTTIKVADDIETDTSYEITVKCGEYTKILKVNIVSEHVHNYKKEMTKEPTCSEVGTMTYRCSCDDTYTEDIPTIKHDFENGVCKNCQLEQIPGLYDIDDNLIVTWEESGIDVSKNYYSEYNYNSNSLYYTNATTSGYYVLRNVYPETAKIVMPDNITKIGNNAFCYSSQILEIKLPKNLINIGEKSFYNLYNTKLIIVPNTVTAIGTNAFYNIDVVCYNGNATGKVWGADKIHDFTENKCKYCGIEQPDLSDEPGLYDINGNLIVTWDESSIDITKDYNTNSNDPLSYKVATTSGYYVTTITYPNTANIIMPNDITEIGANCFRECRGINTIKLSDNLVSVGEYAFYNCREIISLELPNTLQNIGDSSFYNLRSIVKLEIPEGITTIPDNAFSGLCNLETLIIPNNVTTLGEYSFCCVCNLKELTIPNSITEIPEGAFDSLENVEKITLPNNLTYIGDYAFEYCEKLKEITIPDSVTYIGEYAFESCMELEKVQMPNQLTTLGEGAFECCEKLKSITIPNGVTRIEPWLFDYCPELTEVNLHDNITYIGKGAFWDCSSLKKITLPSELTYIGESAFNECIALKQVQIPSKVTEINKYAFQDCTSLFGLKIPATVQNIGIDAFSNVPIICNFTSLSGSPWGAIKNHDRTDINITEATCDKPGSIAFKCTICGETIVEKITVPHIFDENDVCTVCGNEIEPGFYDENNNMLLSWEESKADVSINYSTDSNEEYYYKTTKTHPYYIINNICPSTVKVVLPKNIDEIGNNAFYYCTNLTEIILNEVASVGDNAFHSCRGLTKIDLTNTKSIGSHAFCYCSNLVNVELNNVETILDRAFYDCEKLTNINLTTVKSIGVYAFYYCTSLTEIRLDNIINIDSDAFYRCNNLVLIVSDNIQTIKNDSAFLVKTVCYDGILTGAPWGASKLHSYVDGYCEYCNRMDHTHNYEESNRTAATCDKPGIITYTCTICNKSYEDKLVIPHVYDENNNCINCGYYLAPGLYDKNDQLIALWEETGIDVTKDYSYNSNDENYYVTNSTNPYYVVTNKYTNTSKIVLPNDITKIGNCVFYNNDYLTSIKLPNKLEEIGEHTFNSCDNLTSIDIPNTTLTINNFAFAYCCALKYVKLPSNLTRINEGLFQSCLKLTTIEIPDTVEYIGTKAFSGSELTFIELPSELTYIGSRAFESCNFTTIELPDKIESIEARTFCNCYYLNSIELPQNLTTINESAFYNCGNLLSITIPNNVSYIGNNAFYYCDKLTNVIIPDNVTTIGTNAFYNVKIICYNGEATGSPWGAKQIHDYKSVITKPTCTEKGYTTHTCEKCENSYIDNETEVIEHTAGEWYIIKEPTCTKTGIKKQNCTVCKTEIACEEIPINENVHNYINNVCIECNKQEPGLYNADNIMLCTWEESGIDLSINYEYAYETAETSAYYVLTNKYPDTTKVIIPYEITRIEPYAFMKCKNLTSVEIPNSVITIGGLAFYDCENLVSIEIPNSVTYIGNNAFSYCTNLSNIKLSENLTRIENEVFKDCTNLKNIDLPKKLKSILYHSFEYCTGLTSIEIPEGVTFIGGSAFNGCMNLTSVTIPSSVIEIDDYAFQNCIKLNNIEIPNNVTNIGEYAFYDCEKLTDIEIPESVINIGEYAFSACVGLTNITVDENNPKYDSRNNCNAIIETETNKLINGCQNTIIPEDITNITNGAFLGCVELIDIEIPNNVTNIGKYAFYNCKKLTDIEIPESVINIDKCAFSACAGLTNMTVDENNTKYDSRNNCNAIIETETNTLINGCQNTIIPEDIINIGEYAFYYCTNLTNIIIPDSVTSIGNYAFDYCNKLTNIVIPKNVTNIGIYAFYSTLTEAIFEDTTTWCVQKPGNTSSTVLNSDKLSNASTAAKYLALTYDDRYWTKED